MYNLLEEATTTGKLKRKKVEKLLEEIEGKRIPKETKYD
jgi:hypothetical protein